MVISIVLILMVKGKESFALYSKQPFVYSQGTVDQS